MFTVKSSSGCRSQWLRRGISFAGFVAIFGALRVAQAADVCVEVDRQRDTLTEEERAATRNLLVQTFEENDQRVVASGCAVTYRVYHLRLGSSITVILSNRSDQQKLKVGKIEDVPNAYSQLVKALLTGRPLGVEGGTVDRSNVTDSQVAPNRISADSLWYVRLGYGGIAASGLKTGPAFGFGYRYELDRIAIDASFLNFVVTQKDSAYDAVSGSWLKLGALYYFDPFANSSLYAGGGIGWGGSNVQVDGTNYNNSGLDVGLSAGFEMLRASTIRIFLQFDATLPTYAIHGRIPDPTGTASRPDSIYAPSFALSLGLGFGKSNTIGVKKLD